MKISIAFFCATGSTSPHEDARAISSSAWRCDHILLAAWLPGARGAKSGAAELLSPLWSSSYRLLIKSTKAGPPK